MSVDRLIRIAEQHVRTDQLLGLDAVPLSKCEAQSSKLDAAGAQPQAAAQTATTSHREPRTSHPALALDRQGRLEVLTVLDEQEVRGCTRCALHHSRRQTVFGEGDPEAKLMFVGEGPGQREDEQGRPFVGPAGELLEKMIVAMGLTREGVYIANVVKCRPPNNRTPTPEEAATCGDYLRRQIQTIRPAVIVTLGAPAAKLLLETTTGIMKLRGVWHEYHGVQPAIPVMPTFHPAYLLRAYTKDNRAKVWSDLQQAMGRL